MFRFILVALALGLAHCVGLDNIKRASVAASEATRDLVKGLRPILAEASRTVREGAQ
jgi:hypothetical protein